MIGLLRYKSLIVEVSSTYLKRVIALESLKSSVSLPRSFDGFVLYRNTLFPVISERAFELFLGEQEVPDNSGQTEPLSLERDSTEVPGKNPSRKLFALLTKQEHICALPVDEVLTIVEYPNSSVRFKDAKILLDVPALIEHITSRKGQ